MTLENIIRLALVVIILGLLTWWPSPAPPPPSRDAQVIGLQLRTIANQIEASELPNKSDIAERVEALSAEVLAAQ